MTPQLLKQGSKGPMVIALQKFLNLKGKLPSAVPEDGLYGPDTKDAVKLFQKKSGLKVDGIVGWDTAGALTKLVGPSSASFAKAFGPPPAAVDAKAAGAAKPEGDKKEAAKPVEKMYIVPANGKTYMFTQKEFDDLNKQMLAELKRTAVLAATQRVVMARSYWDSYNDLNKDQYIVSWLVNLGGVGGRGLPDEGIIKKAESAQKSLKNAVDGGDFRQVVQELKNASDPINEACDAMKKYQEGSGGRADNWVTGLSFVRDTSFEVVSTIATAELGGTPASGAIAGGGSELVKSAANEFGKYLAGTSGGGADAAKAIVLDGVLGAASGAVSALIKVKGEKLIEGVAGAAAKKVTGKWASRLGTKAVEEFIKNRLAGGAKGGLEAAVKSACNAVKGQTTLEQFFEEVAKGIGMGAVFGSFDSWVQNKFADSVYKKMSPAFRTKFFGKLSSKEAVDLLKDLVGGKGGEAVAKSIEVAFDKAKGSESAEDLGEAAAADFANTGVKTLEAEIAKRVKAG